MPIFATLFGKLAQRLSPDSISETLRSHVGVVPNPLSERSKHLQPRIHDAQMFKSVCPYCAVGCGQRIYVKDGKVIDIEGDYDSPISGGCLCPKGGASFQLDINNRRWTTVKYRAPYATEWEERPLDWAMDRIAQLVYETREATFQETNDDGKPINNTLAIGSLGGATLDNEENYLITKLFHSLGMVCIENQARIWHSASVPGLGASFGRGSATTFLQDLQNSDCIFIIGSNFAECHPVGFRWVMAAKERGATIIHVDPHFSRTSQHADIYAPIRVGTDIAFVGGLINYILQRDLYFKEYVQAYTNAAFIIGEDYQDAEVLEGVFSGLKDDHSAYDTASWQYKMTKHGESQEPTDKADASPKRATSHHNEQHIMPDAQEGQGLLPNTI